MKYLIFRGTVKVGIEADAVGLVLDDGTEYELQFRTSNNEVSLSTDGQLTIEPQASNVIRISVKR